MNIQLWRNFSFFNKMMIQSLSCQSLRKQTLFNNSSFSHLIYLEKLIWARWFGLYLKNTWSNILLKEKIWYIWVILISILSIIESSTSRFEAFEVLARQGPQKLIKLKSSELNKWLINGWSAFRSCLAQRRRCCGSKIRFDHGFGFLDRCPQDQEISGVRNRCETGWKRLLEVAVS